MTAQITHFFSGEDLLTAQNKNTPPDIIFIDIFMKGISGIETAKNIVRKRGSRFVFTTNSREYALEAFSLNAAHYLLKPLTKEAVREALRRCLPRLEDAEARMLEIKTGQGITPIPTDNIIYIEVYNKICTIHTEKNSFHTYTSLDSLFEHLDMVSFMRAQRSFIVNMKYIESFYFDRIILHGGKTIVLSRTNRAKLKKQYEQFLFHLARRGAI